LFHPHILSPLLFPPPLAWRKYIKLIFICFECVLFFVLSSSSEQ
jgi:hypothetical protein